MYKRWIVVLTTMIYILTGCGVQNEYVAQGMQYVEDAQYSDAIDSLNKAKEIFTGLNTMFGMNFIIPENSQFGTVIGAALSK